MSGSKPDIRAIFCEALERESPRELAAYLDDACGDDAQLREKVENLLRAHREAGDYLHAAEPAEEETLASPILERPGSQIGPYKLLQQIGEGGMGVVYMAEQTKPVERRVAVKIIKPGMDTRQVIARFEAERQALAMMDHPNIAKVLDAGTTDSGRPFFVMELVNGIPVTKFCDAQHLTARERLELFIPICQAVQHAHQKGIIHRDIKPSNILVALYDGRPVPKVIDFGVAKATGGRLTEKTIFTGLGQIVGTIEYMSPEQAQRNQLDIDTRSDVYSLGVVLYELLTGDTPFDKHRLRSAAIDELLRIIREEEPPRPSLRLSSSQSLPSIAANRRIEPKKLSPLVRGELDWIVMKALEKDRARRYESANAFAADVNRYLNDEPVQACPPSAMYRFRKYARRNKPVVAVVSILMLAIVSGSAGLMVSNHMIALERDAKDEALLEKDRALSEKSQALEAAQQAEKEQVRLRQLSEQQGQLAEARRQEADKERQRAEANYRMARETVDRLFTRVAEDLQDQPRMEQIRRKLLEDALRFYQGFLKDRSDNPELKFETAMAYHRVAEIFELLGDWNKCLDNGWSADKLLEQLLRLSPGNLEYRVQQARARYSLAEALHRLGKNAEAKTILEDGISKWEELNREQSRPPEYLEELVRIKVLARDRFYYAFEDWHKYQSLWKTTGELVQELRTKHPAYPLSEQRAGHPSDYSVYDLPKDPKKLQELEQFYRERLPIVENAAASYPDAPAYQSSLASLMDTLINVLLARNRFQEMEPLHLKQLAIWESLVGRLPDDLLYNMRLGYAHYNYGMFLYYLDRESEAREHFQKGIKLISFGMEKEPNVKRHVGILIGALIHCPTRESRDPERALRLAQLYGEPEGKIFSQINACLYREALEGCQDYLKSYPEAKEKKLFFPDVSVPIYQMLEGFCRWHLEDKEEAKRRYLQAKERFDQSPANHYWFKLEFRLRVQEMEKEMGIERPAEERNVERTEAVSDKSD